MANKPQWRQPWEHQSSNSPVRGSSVAQGFQMAEPMPLFSRLPEDPNAGVPSPSSRRLPPLHAGVSASAEPLQPSSRRTSTSSKSVDTSPPKLPWQHENLGKHKRRRLQEPDKDSRPTTHAYSSLLSLSGRQHQTQSSHGQPPLPSPLVQDKSSGDGGHAANPHEAIDNFETAFGSHLDRPSIVTRSLTPCCPQRCSGDRCSGLRTLLVDIVSEFHDLDLHLQGAIAGEPVQSSQPLPDVEELGLHTPLLWLLEGLRRNNAGIRSLVAPKPPADTHPVVRRSSGVPPPSGKSEGDLETHNRRVGSPDAMKRRRAQEDKEPQVPRRLAPALPPSLTQDAAPRSTDPMSGVSRQLPTATPVAEQPAAPSLSPRPTMSSSSSVYHHLQHSTLQESHQQPTHQYRTLPSPSSLPYPTPHPSHTISLPTPLGGSGPHDSIASPTPAHLQHLQDLQHQVSVKTLALQTLQGEYDALLAKLERQRTKCTTLEKKFEVSDVEINSLTDERERLQSQIVLLETQADELTKSRDDARKEMAESGRQYIRIVEMASKLQAQGADDRKKWEEERKELVQRIQTLELGTSGDNIGDGGDVSANSMDTLRVLPKVSTDVSMPSVLSSMQPITPVSSGETAGNNLEPTADPFTTLGPGGHVQVPSSYPQATAGSAEQDMPDSTADLREEARRLRSRTVMLEETIRTLMDQNRIMQDSLQAVNASGQRMQAVLAKALGGD